MIRTSPNRYNSAVSRPPGNSISSVLKNNIGALFDMLILRCRLTRLPAENGVLGTLCTMISEISDDVAINLTKESMLFDSAFTKLLFRAAIKVSVFLMLLTKTFTVFKP